MTPGTNRRRSIFGAVDLRTGRFLYLVARRAVSATFTAFLEQLLATYPAAPMVAVVCDNVIIHRSKIVQQWLATHPRVRVLHGARYSPHDNPVERIWGALKASLANAPTLTVQGRIRQVHAFFRARAPAEILATAAPHSSPWLPDGYMQNFRQAAWLGRLVILLSSHLTPLGPSGVHWLDDSPDLSCKDNTRQYALDVRCCPEPVGQPHCRANLTVTSSTAGGEECLATLAVQMPSSPPASTTPNRTTQRTWPPAGLQLVGSCLLPTTGTRDLNSVSSHTLTSAACGMLTTTVSGWVGGSGATTR
jgi:transposase